jgi:hypothetical protein
MAQSMPYVTVIDVSVHGASPPLPGPRREPTFLEEKGMRGQQQWWSVLLAAVLMGLVGVTALAAAGEQFRRCARPCANSATSP